MSNMRMAKYETLIEDINSNIKKSRDFLGGGDFVEYQEC